MEAGQPQNSFSRLKTSIALSAPAAPGLRDSPAAPPPAAFSDRAVAPRLPADTARFPAPGPAEAALPPPGRGGGWAALRASPTGAGMAQLLLNTGLKDGNFAGGKRGEWTVESILKNNNNKKNPI